VEMDAAAGMGPPSLSAVSTALRCSYFASGRPAGVCRDSSAQQKQDCERAGTGPSCSRPAGVTKPMQDATYSFASSPDSCQSPAIEC
jgi:hypothetical protein